MPDEHEIHFGVLHPDGTVTDERRIAQSAVRACPHLIIDPLHYRSDGSCRCDDPTHVEMREWEYRWDAAAKLWV